ncbi:gamma-glutamyltransferase [Planotetraspora phitsanulokensis]|uniref:Glutathione hydrolase proenzyme n=1 Tax=Planotetraspora phitsanulokensis TaxID=575192 RepID=A0A8J3U115_9ACTN|nr:gamma-glutamyltransferase [Planotetraspora phitsanulokensis]
MIVSRRRGDTVRRRLLITASAAAVALSSTILPGSLAMGESGHGTVSDTPFGTPTDDKPDPGRSITAVRGDRASNWAEQTGSEVLARHGMVATSQPLAAQAGLDILKRGGNAADAAVATAAMLGVVEPYSAGIGGDMFMLYYSAKDRHLYGLNASGWAPRSWTPEYFKKLGYDADTGVPLYGVHSITVPGAVDGWDQLLRRFGTMDFDQVLKPAITTAEQGYGLTERIHRDWEYMEEDLAQDPDSVKTFLVDGKAPPLYSNVRNPDLAKAYRTLASRGRDAFYKGPIADAILAKVNRLGAKWVPSDLADFRSEWVTPISTTYKGYEVFQTPPNSQGFATLEMLNIVEQCGPRLGYDLAALGPRSATFWQVLVEAKKLAFSDLEAHNADPRFERVPLDRLLSKQYAASLCGKISLTQARAPEIKTVHHGDTVYLTVGDRWGNMVSFIYSIYDYFGSQITVPGYGFPLQDRGNLFSLDPASPNVVAPRKRPFHTIIPAFVMKNGKPLLAFGTMSGDEQPQAQVQEIVNMVDLGMNVQAAGDAARFHHDQATDELDLESGLYDLVGEQLAAWGQKPVRANGDLMGGYQALLFTPDPAAKPPQGGGIDGDPPVNGMYRAGSDFRKDGQAVGW